MPTSVHAAAVLLHLLAAIVWIGGMVFAHFCLRPAAVGTLAPPQRLPLMEAALRRFFALVAVAAVILLASGFALFLPVGARHAPIGWHVMAATGTVMVVVFAWIRLVPYPRLREHCAQAAWPAAAQALDAIRRAVLFNLVLGVATVVAAVAGR